MTSKAHTSRMRRIIITTLLTAAVCITLTSATAGANPVYTLGAHIGKEGVLGGEFGEGSPQGVAVNNSSGDIYIVDGGNRRIQELSSSITPEFLAAWGWQVNKGGSEAFEICTVVSECQRGDDGVGAGELGGEGTLVVNEPAVGVAVDPFSHYVYVTDSSNNRVEYFDAEGNYLHQFDGSEIDGAPAAKPAPTRFSAPRGIAVDSAGHVYVEDTGHNAIDRFSAGGEYECQITGKTPGSATECDNAGSATPDNEGFELAEGQGAGLAVDSTGDVYISDAGHDAVDEFNSSGGFVRQFGAGMLGSPQAVSVDEAGDVFVVSDASVATGGRTVEEFDAAGNQIAEFGVVNAHHETGQSYGIAVTANGSRVYVTDRKFQGSEVLVFGRFAVPKTQVASTPVLGSAVLRGTVNPNSLPVSSCVFELEAGEVGEADEYKHPTVVPCEQSLSGLGSGESPVPVSAEVSGLREYGHYRYRLAAGNLSGVTDGASTALFASVDVFGFQLGGANALTADVSEGEVQSDGWMVADPTKPEWQAGKHPFAVTTRFLVNIESDDNLPPGIAPKDFFVNIPSGFAGSVAKIPRCKMSELSSLTNRILPAGCPTASQVGVVRLFEANSATQRIEEIERQVAVYNMVPPPGVPAEFAFPYFDVAEPVIIQLRADGDYGVTAEVRNVSEAVPIAGSELTLWGVPAAPAHDRERFLPAAGAHNGFPGIEKGGEPKSAGSGEPLPAGTPEVPFLTNPTACGSVENATIMADSWLHPGPLAPDGRPVPGSPGWVTAEANMYPKGIKGCGKLSFQPQLEVKPETTVADSPMGMTVTLKVPQSENVHNLATPSLREATVTLPQGVSISPSAGNGLEGCTPEEIHLHSEAKPECPNGSQIGKLEVVTPLLAETLTGRVYLSTVHSTNVFHMYLVIEGQGVLVKLEGEVKANEQTGQLVSTFRENPQLPFSELKFTFYGGSGAALASPQQCGSYTTTSMLEPWSHTPAPGEAAGTPDAAPLSQPFAIGSGCGDAFAPGFAAGVTNPVAGAYSPFTLAFWREDGEQELSSVQVKAPLGFVGKLAGVAECTQAQIAQAEQSTGAAEKADPSCPAASEIGAVEAGAGPGSSPYFVGGKAYLTGPYKGAPYGIAAIVPALAGPFDLGTVVVRAAIQIDPHTAQVTATSDPFPQMLDGIPLRMRRVEVSIDRPEFAYTPSSCNPTQVTGTLTSTTGAQHAVASRFQVGDCASLPFKPSFSVYTHARHTRRFGDSLRVKVTSGLHQANISSVFVELPKMLPSRVETLKLACSAKQFAENPAGCPEGSHVGTATANTPILGTPLTGPAIFVSHGGAAFPDLDVVLQGDGVTVDLEGNTNIVKGITSSNFKAVPDVPVKTFELTLPAGAHSALAAEGNLCRKAGKPVKLTMPTTITAHNGAQIKQRTVVHVEGCAKHKSQGKKKKK